MNPKAEVLRHLATGLLATVNEAIDLWRPDEETRETISVWTLMIISKTRLDAKSSPINDTETLLMEQSVKKLSVNGAR